MKNPRQRLFGIVLARMKRSADICAAIWAFKALGIVQTANEKIFNFSFARR
jgi:hypothetical protein